MDIADRSLELKLDTGQTITVQVTGYSLSLLDKLHTNEFGNFYKQGTFKITSHHCKAWRNVQAIKYSRGECAVLKGSVPIETPRTITFKIRHDF